MTVTTIFTLDSLITKGTLTKEMAQFLERCVKAKLNIIVSGMLAVGKTKTLEALASCIQPTDHILLLEDRLELNLACKVEIASLGTIVNNPWALKKSDKKYNFDYTIVGECTSTINYTFLKLAKEGHRVLTSSHAGDPQNMLNILARTLFDHDPSITTEQAVRTVSNSVDLIVHQALLRDGTRCITHITEVLHNDKKDFETVNIYEFDPTGEVHDGNQKTPYLTRDISPTLEARLKNAGL